MLFRSITQSCCSDGSCVYACPVNCIHPSPDEPEFAYAEMLYIDPVACVDCGACVDACPVGAIVPAGKLRPEQLLFVDVNARYSGYPERRPAQAPQSTHAAGSMCSISAVAKPGSSGVGWMQLTGQA